MQRHQITWAIVGRLGGLRLRPRQRFGDGDSLAVAEHSAFFQACSNDIRQSVDFLPGRGDEDDITLLREARDIVVGRPLDVVGAGFIEPPEPIDGFHAGASLALRHQLDRSAVFVRRLPADVGQFAGLQPRVPLKDRKEIPRLDAGMLPRVADKNQPGVVTADKIAQFRALASAGNPGLIDQEGRTVQPSTVHGLRIFQEIGQRGGVGESVGAQDAGRGRGRRTRDDGATRCDYSALHFLECERLSGACDSAQGAHSIGRFEQCLNRVSLVGGKSLIRLKLFRALRRAGITPGVDEANRVQLLLQAGPGGVVGP